VTGLDACDLHIHGAFGIDVTTASASELDRLALGLTERGTTSFVPTLVPLPLPALAAALERLAGYIATRRDGDGRGALPLGVHLEGPFVAPTRAGALHREAFLDLANEADTTRVLDLLAAVPGRHVVTLAPEIAGGLDLTADLARRGVLVSIGHTEADFATCEAAVERGARHMTHLCNAMRPLHHREPGPIGFGLACPAISVDLIVDFHHVHPRMVELIAKVKGEGRFVLVSDAAPPAGLPDGRYEVWGETLTLEHGTMRNSSGALAGSAVLLDQCAANLESLGFAAGFARAAASSVPRALLSG
jgi:N-acetylglucosamine-6-phosphate deacetylase